ncbi:MAG: sulfatase activating formylglycine-generating enzyme [Myxococcota bacterium]|jgi:formylglycine-generating enzyme required for sulfatase activity
MQFINGPTLEQWMTRHGALSASQVRALFLPILAGVGEAHAHGVVHRDLKPANVLLLPERDGTHRPMIADFGIAKIADDARLNHERRNHTKAQMRMGTLVYMAPEQILHASKVDRRADIFALGAILYELATGRHAFDGPTDFVVMSLIVDGDPSTMEGLDDIDPRIAACVRRALARDPGERFPDCEIFATYLLGDSAVPAPKRPVQTVSKAPQQVEAPFVPPDIRPRVPPRTARPSHVSADTGPALPDALVAEIGGPELPDRVQVKPLAPKPRRRTGLWLTALALLAVPVVGCVGLGAWQYPELELYYATHVAHTPNELRHSAWTARHGIRLRYVPEGRVSMGSMPAESGRDQDEVRYDVTVRRPFLAMETEVTQGQWTSLMGSEPNKTRKRLWDGTAGGPCDDGPQGPGYPVTCVDWNDAIAFANALSAEEGLTPAYSIEGRAVTVDLLAPGYRLPTEAEWVRMATGDVRQLYGQVSSAQALCDVGNVAGRATRAQDSASLQPIPCDDAYVGAAPVGQFRPNGYGLYDLVGNAWEWTFDIYTPIPEAGAHLRDWVGPSSGSSRVLKGGSWFNPADVLRVNNRYSQEPGGRSAVVGFRLVRTFRTADAGNGRLID